MQVEVIYNQAQNSLEFAQPLRLKRDHLRLVVTVPDDAVATEPVVPVEEGTMEARVRAILRPYQHLLDRAAADGSLDYDAIRDEYLAEKYLGKP
jgi:hypothetical protein